MCLPKERNTKVRKRKGTIGRNETKRIASGRLRGPLHFACKYLSTRKAHCSLSRHRHEPPVLSPLTRFVRCTLSRARRPQTPQLPAGFVNHMDLIKGAKTNPNRGTLRPRLLARHRVLERGRTENRDSLFCSRGRKTLFVPTNRPTNLTVVLRLSVVLSTRITRSLKLGIARTRTIWETYFLISDSGKIESDRIGSDRIGSDRVGSLRAVFL